LISGEWHALLATAIISAAYWRKIRLEEQHLMSLFGDEYVAYRRQSSALIPFSHWTPPATTPNRRFATWFFVAPWAGDDVCIDGHEIVDHRWLSPMEAVAARLPLAPPTWVTLHHLAAFGSLAAIQREPPTVEHYLTQPAKLGGELVLLWHGDAGYGDVGDPASDGPRHRLWMPADGSWRYERSGP
jgi:hypothetical protein